MATESDIVTKAVEGALEQIQKYAPEHYEKLNADPKKKKAIIESARSAANEQVLLSKEFVGQPQDIAEQLAKHLPAARIKMIREALDIPTFRMDISKKSDDKHWVELTREGKPLMPARVLLQSADIDWATIKQYASIIVEAVMLVMSAAGISVSPSEHAIEGAIEDAVEAIQASTRLQQAIEDFITAWNAAGGNAWAKAKALFYLIKESYALGILWTIIKSICREMAWYEWVETAAKVTAMLIAALATDGAALIAEIALIVMSAVDFARKIANVMQLSEIKKTSSEME